MYARSTHIERFIRVSNLDYHCSNNSEELSFLAFNLIQTFCTFCDQYARNISTAIRLYSIWTHFNALISSFVFTVKFIKTSCQYKIKENETWYHIFDHCCFIVNGGECITVNPHFEEKSQKKLFLTSVHHQFMSVPIHYFMMFYQTYLICPNKMLVYYY